MVRAAALAGMRPTVKVSNAKAAKHPGPKRGAEPEIPNECGLDAYEFLRRP